MRSSVDSETERGRVGGPPGATYGAFKLVNPDTGRLLTIIVSDGRDWSEAGLPGPAWEHVSVSTLFGCPMWSEMCWVKDLFWMPEEWVCQYHPAASQYVNIHKNVLHMWKPVGIEFPAPPKECV